MKGFFARLTRIIDMAGEGEWGEAAFGDVDIQFFRKFPNQSAFRRFAFIHLTARKFPEPRHGFALGSFRHQHTTVRIDQRDGRNQNCRHIAIGLFDVYAVAAVIRIGSLH